VDENGRDALAAEVARLAQDSGRTVAVAESLTGGMVAATLARAEASSRWFRGALVAYASEVKRELLDVPEGPVVSATAAAAMARGARRLLGADVAVATTGAGGPSPQDGVPPGTVYVAVAVEDGDREVRRLALEGEPSEVCAAAAAEALRGLVAALRAPARARG
jgi:nicotinamide-nucleotide amidase